MIKDKNILITGGNSGIGFFTTINLLKTQNNLYIPIRSISRKEEFLLKLIKYFDKEYIDKHINLIDNIDLSNLENIHPNVKNLCTKTDIFDIAKLSENSIISVGNDTGPMHVIANGNMPTFVFFTKYSDPKLCAPVGKNVKIFNYENNIEKLSIIDTKKENGVIVHFVDRLPNNLNASFKAKVNGERRNKISKNHSATHLLHDALRTVLGEHVEQKGSLVNEHYLRFDFSHFSKLSMNELFAVENLVKEQIREANPLIEDRNTPLETAKKRGAMMLFGEKYGDSVRVIQFGNSIELCGGIHVSNSAHIGNFIIKSESSISSGIRRIEAVSSNEADQIIFNKLEAFDNISKILKVQDDLSGAVQELVIKNSELQKELDSFNKEKLKKIKNQLLSNLDKSNSFSLIEHHSDLSADQMKQIAFELKGELSNFILLLTSNLNNKPVITLMISENLVQSKGWNAGSIIRNLAIEIKGGGGGQPFFATAGGSDVDGIKNVIEKAKEIFKD